ncbi:copper chaperone PCu(A)C [Parasulfuritortus cantonensis]|uniref:Copper chaperone PCu(A)C n=1 Tax=Parasulfuritortus cantonensis TaxID=2528202 RepID=A0A4R1B353_9PROT|nr:copper chaperone PCu(A)C [Parasulfuritortus cantonensis]TCJ11900.1 copper chaperone PCu(A)C [Parasulfuritortus cantonensis]
MRIPTLFCAAAMAVSVNAAATDVRVDHAWMRATLPGQRVAAGFMDLTAGRDLVLVGASSPVAETVEFHSMGVADGKMQMRALKTIALPKGKTVGLAPGGMHVMLIGIKAPIGAGRPVPVQLVFEDGRGGKSTATVEMRVSPRQD